MSQDEELVRSVVPEQFLHSPKMPDLQFYPFDQPATMRRIRQNGLEVVSRGILKALEDELVDMTERCRSAEYRVRALFSKETIS